MGRRKKKRFVNTAPRASFFKPSGIPARELEKQELTLDGFEALRLVDCEGMQQQDAAELMGISRPTLSRILSEARKAVATALTKGRAIQIEGGEFHYVGGCDSDSPNSGGDDMPGQGRCCTRQGGGKGQGQGRGMGQGKGQGMGRARARSTQGADSGVSPAKLPSGKVAITSEGPTLDSNVDPRFGRAAGFVVVDPATMTFSYVDNGASQVMAQGAGIQAAETIANAGASALLTGYVGPKAFTALTAAGIAIGQDIDGMTIREAVEKYKSGAITMADSPNAASGTNK